MTRSQQTGRRYFNISFPCETLAQATISAGSYYSNVIRTNPFWSPVGTNATTANFNGNAAALVASTAYRAYTRLYDSVKINSVSLTISLATTIGEGGIPGIRVYTAWDRGLQWGEDPISYTDLMEGPEAQVITFINNSRARLYRTNRASDLQERTTFHDCTVKYQANNAYYDVEFGTAQNMTVGYVPSLSLVLMASDQTAADRVVPIQIQARYNVTFRNPKYGLSADSSAKFGEQKAEILDGIVEEEKEAPVAKKEKVVYEEEVLPDDDDTLIDDDEEEQEPVTQKKTILKKAGKKSSS